MCKLVIIAYLSYFYKYSPNVVIDENEQIEWFCRLFAGGQE